MIWQAEPALERTAENAQSVIRFWADDHIAGAVDIDAVAVLAGAAVGGADALDAVVGDQRAVFAFCRPPHQDAVIAAVADGVAGDLKPGCIDREHRRLDRPGDRAGGDPPDCSG